MKKLGSLFLFVMVALVAPMALAEAKVAEAPSCSAGVNLETIESELVESFLEQFESSMSCPDQRPCDSISGCVDDQCNTQDTGVNGICDGAPACPPGQTIHVTTCTCAGSGLCAIGGLTWSCA